MVTRVASDGLTWALAMFAEPSCSRAQMPASGLMLPSMSPPIQVHGGDVSCPQHVQLRESGLGGVGTGTRISWYLVMVRKHVERKSKNFAAKCLVGAILSGVGALSKFHSALPFTLGLGHERSCRGGGGVVVGWWWRSSSGFLGAGGQLWPHLRGNALQIEVWSGAHPRGFGETTWGKRRWFQREPGNSS